MGYDLYGNSPQAYEGKDFPIYTKYKDMDWDEKEKHIDWKEDKDKYFKEEHSLDRTTGSYFRANVWWWRQLWIFTCMVCDDVMTENDRDAGDSNDGIEITEETCAKMLPLMKQAIKNKDHEKYEDDVMDTWKIDAGNVNDGIEIDEETCAKMLPLMNQAIKNKDHEKYEADVTQYIDGVKKDKNGNIKSDEDWMAHYPFTASFFEEFTTFVERSGGFTIS